MVNSHQDRWKNGTLGMVRHAPWSDEKNGIIEQWYAQVICNDRTLEMVNMSSRSMEKWNTGNGKT